MTFGGNKPTSMTITMNSLPIPWENKVIYLGLYFSGITGNVDITSTLRKFYGQIMSVLGKGSHEMNAVYLVKTYCLPTLTYGCENVVLCENTKRKISVT